MWFGSANLGAFVRRADGTYARTTQHASILRAVENIGPAVAFTLSCDSVSVLLESMEPDQTEIEFMDGSTLPTVATVGDIKDDGSYRSDRVYACLCRKEHYILVCASSPPELLAQAAALEAQLVGMVFGCTSYL